MFSVGWAGETESENWFDIAREYTEKWHHQQQIREAIGKLLLVEEQWLSRLIYTLIRGIPPVYNKFASKPKHEQIEIYISGVIDDSWMLALQQSQWRLYKSNGNKLKRQLK